MIRRRFQVMFVKSLLFLSVALVVFAEDVRRAFFVVKDGQHFISMEDSVLQDKRVSDCTKNKDCKFVIKHTTKGEKISSTWNKVIIPKMVGNEDCLNLRETGQTESRVFPIIINGIREQIPCDMTSEGGGWTIFQRRVDGEVDFYRNWSDYKIGFGDREKDFWLGLDLIHTMVSQGQSELRVDLTNYKGQSAYSKYERFYVGDESEIYKLTVSGYSGTAGDAMTYHNGMKFTTKDRDNDRNRLNCAIRFKGAFWHSHCYYANLNGLYPKEGERNKSYISWIKYEPKFGGISFVEMKFRRKLPRD